MIDPWSYRAALYAAAQIVERPPCPDTRQDVAAAIRALPVPEGGAATDPLAEIAAERHRQVEVEGWTVEHDDAHSQGEMAIAAGCYAIHAGGRRDMKWSRVSDNGGMGRIPRGWPWEWRWWKPTMPRRDLIKAAALIVAEIERLDRAVLGDAPCP